MTYDYDVKPCDDVLSKAFDSIRTLCLGGRHIHLVLFCHFTGNQILPKIPKAIWYAAALLVLDLNRTWEAKCARQVNTIP